MNENMCNKFETTSSAYSDLCVLRMSNFMKFSQYIIINLYLDLIDHILKFWSRYSLIFGGKMSAVDLVLIFVVPCHDTLGNSDVMVGGSVVCVDQQD
jgi:hypothetical protein